MPPGMAAYSRIAVNKLIEKWNALAPWQQRLAWCVAGAAGTWLVFGATAALGFGLGAFGGVSLGRALPPVRPA